jgi:hypothetical protein
MKPQRENVFSTFHGNHMIQSKTREDLVRKGDTLKSSSSKEKY